MIVAKDREKSTESRQITAGDYQGTHQKPSDCWRKLPRKPPKIAWLLPRTAEKTHRKPSACEAKPDLTRSRQPTKKPQPQPATGARFKSDYFADLSSDFASSSSSIAEMTTLPSTKSADNAFLPGLSK